MVMTYNAAKRQFRKAPCNKNAGLYLEAALLAECDDTEGDDEIQNAISEVAYWLQYDRQIA